MSTNNTAARTREVLLVTETSYHYYIEDPDGTMTDEQALAAAKEKLDQGVPDENPACGWIKVLRHEVKEV
jgi:hypothetical protein